MKNTKKISTPHEKEIAEHLKGRTVIASGAISGMKGDVITPQFLVECKATLKNFYILKAKVVRKIRSEALRVNRIPLLAIRVSGKDFILIRQYDFFLREDRESITYLNETLKIRLEDLSKECLVVEIDGYAHSIMPLEKFKEELL